MAEEIDPASPTPAERRRIVWQQGDEEDVLSPRNPTTRPLQRRQSNSSMSIRSVNRRASVDPSVLLPIQYRSM
jgi:hypothetical protein